MGICEHAVSLGVEQQDAAYDPPRRADYRQGNSFFDILDDLKFALMGSAEARHGRLVLFGDLMYVSLGTSADGHVGR